MFNCTQCGLCCLHARELFQGHRESFNGDVAKEFPYKFDEGGACEKFDKKTKLCTVYETRPEICNITAMFKHFPVKVDIEEYFRLNEEACKVLQQAEANDSLGSVAVPAKQ